MTNDEEKQLRQELLDLDLRLRRKQEFWETPRNLAILVGLTALIAAAIGYWLGRGSASIPLLLRPIRLGSFGDMRLDQLVEAAQTASLVVITAILAYVVVRLDRTLTMAAGELKKALAVQQALHERITRVWERVDLIESRQDEVRSRLARLEHPP